MGLSLTEFRNYLDEIDKDMAEMFPGMGSPQQDTLANSQNYQTIVALLHQYPIMVGPTLTWLTQKLAEVEQAKLEILFTPEQLEAMRADLASRST